MNTTFPQTAPTKISISLADEQDRQVIYALRHEVYARELGQHARKQGMSSDRQTRLD